MEAACMFPFHAAPPSSRKGARGFSLVVALIFLLVLSMLGIVGIRNVILHERMAGNTQDWNLAFQTAEAALRDGENDAIARAAFISPDDLFIYNAAGCGATANGVCLPSNNGIPLWVRMAGGDDPCWRDGADGENECETSQQYGAQTGSAALTDPNSDDDAELDRQPRYVIENLDLIRNLKTEKYGDKHKYALRVTAVGFGKIRTSAGDPATRVVLQTTIGPK